MPELSSKNRDKSDREKTRHQEKIRSDFICALLSEYEVFIRFAMIHSPDFPPSLYSPSCLACMPLSRTAKVGMSHFLMKTEDLTRKHLTFASEDKLIEMAERGKADLNLESREAIQHGMRLAGAAST